MTTDIFKPFILFFKSLLTPKKMEFGICPVCDSGYLHLSTNKTLVCDNCHYEENAHERASMIYEDDSNDRVVAPKWDKQPPKKKRG